MEFVIIKLNTGCNRIRFTNMKICFDQTNSNAATQFVEEHLSTLQVSFTNVQYGCPCLCGRHTGGILILSQFVQAGNIYQNYSVNSPVTKLLKVHWSGWCVHIIFHESRK
jgi:hypothetical protein